MDGPPTPRPGRLAVLLVALLGAACRVPDLHVQNLQALHEDDGSARYVADLTSAVDYGLGWLTGGGLEDGPERVDDPFEETLENLLALASFDSRLPRNAGLQVQMFAWLAVDDPFVLARERCVIELGRHARRLGLTGVEALPEDAVPAGPEEVVRRLEELQARAVPVLRGDPAGDPFELARSCERVRDLVVDRAAARRLLGYANIALALHAGRGVAPEVLRASAPFYALHEDLQRTLVSQALAAVLDDPHPRVRGAAFRAVYPLPDTDRRALLAQAMRDPATEAAVSAVHTVAAFGLPEEAPPDDLGGGEWIDVLLALANGFDGRLSAAACRALSAETGRALDTLRPEDWSAWRASRGAGAPADS